MSKVLLWSYEASIILVGAMLVLAQVLTPVLARELAGGAQEAQPHVGLYSATAIAALLCCEVILVALGRLAVLAADGRIASPSSLRAADAICVAAAVVAALALFALLHLILVARIGGPLPVLVCFGAALAAASALVGGLCARSVLRGQMEGRQKIDQAVLVS